MQKFDAWAIAAAILLEGKCAMHSDDITGALIESGLAVLGSKGRTPERSVNSLLHKHRLFRNTYHGSGYFELINPEAAAAEPQVAAAQRALAQSLRAREESRKSEEASQTAVETLRRQLSKTELQLTTAQGLIANLRNQNDANSQELDRVALEVKQLQAVNESLRTKLKKIAKLCAVVK